MITLYHGTINENAEAIITAGFLRGPVYLSPNESTAADYVLNNESSGVIFEIDIDESILKIDRESFDGTDLDEALDLGVSVFTNSNVDISSAIIHHI